VECIASRDFDWRQVAGRPPDAFVVDLSRLPSHGRRVAVYLRERPATRSLPLLFVEGAPEVVAKLREEFPHADFASWRGVRGALKRALTRPPREVPPPPRAGYSGKPLAAKLGIQKAMLVLLVDAPAGFAQTLGALPEGAKLSSSPRGSCELAIFFPKSKSDLARRFAGVAARTGNGGVWISWPKKASGVPTDLTEDVLREVILPKGWVDVKVCAVDATYSGLQFRKRRA
jgi:hypothetical protein